MDITPLLNDIEYVRSQLLDGVKDLTQGQANFKISPDEWSVTEIVEHLVWAEQGGICGMYKAIEGIRINKPVWTGASKNHGLTIEQIVENTWQQKEQVPAVAAPKWGGPLKFWNANLANCQLLLREFQLYAMDVNLELAIYPHPISGPLNIIQRLEFLRFHMDRHLKQIQRVKKDNDFPGS